VVLFVCFGDEYYDNFFELRVAGCGLEWVVVFRVGFSPLYLYILGLDRIKLYTLKFRSLEPFLANEDESFVPNNLGARPWSNGDKY
jgi:hypothetical protein